MNNEMWDLIDECSKMKSAHDGHFTLMRFTTHWKAMFNTPNLDSGDGRDEVKRIEPSETAEGAVIIAIRDLMKEIKKTKLL